MDIFQLAKIGVMLAVLVGVVNMITLQEYWILGVSLAVLIPSVILFVKNRKIFQKLIENTYIIPRG